MVRNCAFVICSSSVRVCRTGKVNRDRLPSFIRGGPPALLAELITALGDVEDTMCTLWPLPVINQKSAPGCSLAMSLTGALTEWPLGFPPAAGTESPRPGGDEAGGSDGKKINAPPKNSSLPETRCRSPKKSSLLKKVFAPQKKFLRSRALTFWGEHIPFFRMWYVEAQNRVLSRWFPSRPVP